MDRFTYLKSQIKGWKEQRTHAVMRAGDNPETDPGVNMCDVLLQAAEHAEERYPASESAFRDTFACLPAWTTLTIRNMVVRGDNGKQGFVEIGQTPNGYTATWYTAVGSRRDRAQHKDLYLALAQAVEWLEKYRTEGH